MSAEMSWEVKDQADTNIKLQTLEAREIWNERPTKSTARSGAENWNYFLGYCSNIDFLANIEINK